MMETLKKHPVAAGGLIIAFIVIVVIATGGSSSSNNDASGASGVDPLAQLQAQKEMAMASNATALQMRQLDSQDKAAELAANQTIALESLHVNAASTDMANTLAATIQGQQIKAQSDAVNAQYASIASQIATQASISTAAINAQVQVAQINKPKRGLFSKIFG